MSSSFHPQKRWNADAVTHSKKWQQTSSEDYVHRMLQLNPRRPFGNNSVTRIRTHSYRHDYTIGPVFIMLFWRPADCIQGKGKPLLFSQNTTGQEIWQKITGAFQNLYRKSSSSTWQHCFRPAHSLLCILSRESSCLASSDAICSLPLLIWHKFQWAPVTSWQYHTNLLTASGL